MPTPTNRNNLKLWFIVLTFAIPLAISYLLFYFYPHFNFGHTNHGTILKTPIDVSYFYPQDGTDAAQKKWRIVYINNGDCDKTCQMLTHQLTQLQKALGKDGNRVHLTFMGSRYEGVNKLASALSHQQQSISVDNKIYLVDPLGNLFMYYPAETDVVNVLKDMKKVLEVSQIG